MVTTFEAPGSLEEEAREAMAAVNSGGLLDAEGKDQLKLPLDGGENVEDDHTITDQPSTRHRGGYYRGRFRPESGGSGIPYDVKGEYDDAEIGDTEVGLAMVRAVLSLKKARLQEELARGPRPAEPRERSTNPAIVNAHRVAKEIKDRAAEARRNPVSSKPADLTPAPKVPKRKTTLF